jgi:hypothetical protein
MSMTAADAALPARARAIPSHAVLAAYTAAIFLSAALLFAVQPLFAKMVLPQLGGSPAVWSVAMVFFQATLLAGYAYAHVLTRHLPGRLAVVAHVGLLVVAAFALPLAIAGGWGRPPIEGEAIWLLGLFAASIGLPFFALSANGPLLQAWFARTDHPSANDPYFLYAASNVGSFLALIAYPFALEPLTRLGEQTRMWSIGFFILIALIAACGALMWRTRGALPSFRSEAAGEAAPPTWRDAAVWVGLAAVPSGLLIAVTSHISTDVAAAPFLWIVPLALYLATFIIVFQSKPVLPHARMVAIEPVFIVGLVILLIFSGFSGILTATIGHVACFFVIALVCHGELARRRPAARHLTAFYMWMSTGGMIGGIAAGLVAPHVFSWVAEYPILIVLAILCRPGLRFGEGRSNTLVWLGLAALVVLVAVIGPNLGFGFEDRRYRALIGVLLALSVPFWNDALKFAALIALTLVAAHLYAPDAGRRDSVRSFFGVHKVVDSPDGRFRALQHGTTEHGVQRIADDAGNPIVGRPEPISYYHAAAPLAQGIRAARARRQSPINLAVIGLGTGTTACLTEAGDTLTYYEIDPAVIRIAKDPKRFTFLSECAPNAGVVVGDARLTLADAPDEHYDVIAMDAFTSDAVPVHLITREAMAIYLKKLSPHGIILVHVSNRHMELGSVAAGIAHANGLVTWFKNGRAGTDMANYKFSSAVAAVARREDDFSPEMANDPEWKVRKPDPAQWVWTDDYSNIIGAMLRHARR